MPSAEQKAVYFERLTNLLAEYPKILLVGCDNVGSHHLQTIRKTVRGKAEILMGKNTMIRKCLKSQLESRPDLEELIPHIRGNIGFVFTNGDLGEIRDALLSERVEAPAKAGSIAPNDVIVPAGPTGMEPTQTSFLQALNIASKIVRGQVEIISDVSLVTAGEKVGNSEAALLQRLGIKPFSYGLGVEKVFENGKVYDASVLALSDGDILNSFFAGVRNVASIGLECNYPNAASVPHSLKNGFNKVVSIALGTEFSFDLADQIKEMLANPGAFASAAPSGGSGGGAAAAEPEPEPEPEEESAEEDLGGGLFGDDDGW